RLQGAQPSTLVVWSSDRDGCCVAEVRCPLMNFFCDEGHLHAWLATSPDERGTSLSILEAVEVGKAAFGELLGGAPSFAPFLGTCHGLSLSSSVSAATQHRSRHTTSAPVVRSYRSFRAVGPSTPRGPPHRVGEWPRSPRCVPDDKG